MFDLIIMLSRYLFIFYIVLFLWQGIVYVAYEQGGFLGNPYTAVSMQRRITVLMHMTAFLILGYNRETYMFDITTLLFGAISLVFLLFAVKLLDRFYYEGCPLLRRYRPGLPASGSSCLTFRFLTIWRRRGCCF